jgi:catechol 2,3-dioxygenase-like lactoylglutathione lyase family enzyme
MTAIKFQSAALFVRDIGESRRFYEDLLNQTVDIDFGPSVSYVGGFSLWQMGHAGPLIFDDAPEDMTALGRRNLELCFESGALDGVSERLARAGTTFVHPVREQPWGQRVLRVCDPDGHLVEIGESMSVVVRRLLDGGADVGAVASHTAMPLEFVQRIASGAPATP